MMKWLVLLSLALAAVLVVSVRATFGQQWKDYQSAFYREAVQTASSQDSRDWALAQRQEIKQLYLPDLGRIDRCTTCHLGVTDSAFRNAPEPFREHALLLDSHPPDKFGCTICHGGEGRGTTVDSAHGTSSQGKRLLKAEYLQAACYMCHGERTLPPRVTASVGSGKQVMNKYMCLRCHQTNGEGGSEGPDLSGVGSRRDWVWIYAHTVNPQAMTTGSTMPRFTLTRDELRDITVYLLTLQSGQDRVSDASLIAQKPDLSYAEWPPAPAAAKNIAPVQDGLTPDYQGVQLFRDVGCYYCHSIDGRGGTVGPSLTFIGRKRGRDETVKLLRNPTDVLPGGVMPQLNLTETQVQALADYLTTLR